MFPAFVNDNHWVLGIIDIDGQQFIYYDPLSHPDKHGVMVCAREWMIGEIKSARSEDAFKGLEVSAWPVVQNLCQNPLQTDS